MKGNNVLHLNETTLIEAVQEYLDARMRVNAAPIVTSVKAGQNDTFKIDVREAEPTDPVSKP